MENNKKLLKLNSICLALLKLMEVALKDENLIEWDALCDAYEKVSELEDKYIDKLHQRS